MKTKILAKKKQGIYARYIKRILDIAISSVSLVVLLPVFLVLTVFGIFAMRGNPFFWQERPGKEEKIFKLVKFRTMTNQRGRDGRLLPDEERLTGYGRFLRKTSLDELPELWNILKGDMSLIGPRPLLVEYLGRYSKRQRHRHDVRPGLTGYAQVHGRNTVSWEDKFEMDIYYVRNITFYGDLKIFFQTIGTVLGRKGISSETSATMEKFKGNMQEESQEG